MSKKEYILIVDDEVINRQILKKMLSGTYQVLEAANGKLALERLAEHAENITAIMLDLHMPVMDGYEVLTEMQKVKAYQNLPVIVTTGSSDIESEIRALELGAWDFVSKPYNLRIIQFRLKNAIQRSEIEAYSQLKYMSEHDMLTGLWNRTKFFEETQNMLQENADREFVFVRFDLERFKLINSFFGTQEGDRLLVFLADEIRRFTECYELCTYGRMESDVFCLCLTKANVPLDNLIETLTDKLAEYNSNYSIVPCFGLCEIEDNSLPIETIFMRSALAAKACKGKHAMHYMYYTGQMSEQLGVEQEITNEMNLAIEQEQFEVYFQPKYSLDTNLPYGAEALVRWKHPHKGMISPGVFIPVFEKNGFITRLDYYVWEHVCLYISGAIRAGKPVYPISVNISRVDLYNPNLADIIISLVEKYQVPVHLLNLELTESAYSDNPLQMSLTMKRLQDYGFTIMMDDFGSGYSSLNVLKDIAVDVLKIDMRFFSKTEIEGRGENIIASVIRMAKWLNIPVIAEGVETREQVEFLRSIGCDYVQGFYFARPMPITDYSILCDAQIPAQVKEKKTSEKRIDMDSFFSTNPQMELLFGNMMQPIAICEFGHGSFEVLRVNDAYQELIGYNDLMVRSANPMGLIDEKYRGVLVRAFEKAVETDQITGCEYERDCEGAKHRWLSLKIRHVNEMGDKHVMFVAVTDITEQKKIDFELNKYRAMIASAMNPTYKMLIVDDEETNRVILKEMFMEQYDILEAENGEHALELLKKEPVDIILLDLYMPGMDGREFLDIKNADPDLSEIPVVVITAETSEEEQVKLLSHGVDDYILKPFVKESALKRVSNVAQSSHHMREALF